MIRTKIWLGVEARTGMIGLMPFVNVSSADGIDEAAWQVLERQPLDA